MRTALTPLEVVRPRSLADALARLAAAPDLVPLAGGTDLCVLLNAGHAPAARYLDLWPLRALDYVRLAGRGGDRALRIGARATYTALLRSPVARRHAPALLAAAREVGGPQIQNRGTIAGNVANGSPAGDTLPVLLALDATVTLASARGTRAVRFSDFYTGYRRSVRAADELITEIAIPPPARGTRQHFRKVGTRAAQAISKVVFAAAARRERGRLVGVRLAFGSMAATPLRARAAEAALEGRAPDAATLAAAQDALARDLTPIDDLRSTARYRMAVARNLLAEFVAGPR